MYESRSSPYKGEGNVDEMEGEWKGDGRGSII